jgi:hypothetical protein
MEFKKSTLTAAKDIPKKSMEHLEKDEKQRVEIAGCLRREIKPRRLLIKGDA